jgi:8-oxo-dGTP pyrophosphatase MutT (NUDIX family)
VSVREIAAAILIDTVGRVLLQLRDEKAGIIQPGKVGMFGGHREGNESFLDCAVREVAEEISCNIPANRFQHLLSFDGPDPEISSSGRMKGEFFIVRDVRSDLLVITEGKLLIVRPEELAKLHGELTPAAVIALNAFRRLLESDQATWA